MYPARLKKLDMSSGETWMGRQGKKNRASEKG